MHQTRKRRPFGGTVGSESYISSNKLSMFSTVYRNLENSTHKRNLDLKLNRMVWTVKCNHCITLYTIEVEIKRCVIRILNCLLSEFLIKRNLLIGKVFDRSYSKSLTFLIVIRPVQWNQLPVSYGSHRHFRFCFWSKSLPLSGQKLALY